MLINCNRQTFPGSGFRDVLPPPCSSDFFNLSATHLNTTVGDAEMPSTLLNKAKLPAAYGTWQCCVCNHSISTSPRKKLKPDSRLPTQKRPYADVKSNQGYEFRDSMNWPCRKNTPWTPSPYDIFELERNAVYSKHKFYELVKMYHPDMNGNLTCKLTQVERLERYRLVVQAHEILSDPEKRRAYDACGAGWRASRTATRYTKGYTSSDGKPYGFGPDHDSSIFQNATWEDWEKWYRRHEQPTGSKQAYSGTYAHPNAFASFVILLAILSGVLQATRAGQFSGSLEEKAKAFTEETSRFLSSRANHFEENQIGAEGRIKHFLEKRDPSKYGLKDGEEDAYRKHFTPEVMRPMPDLKDVDVG